MIGLIVSLLNLFNILLIIYVVLSWVRPAQNKWTQLLNRIVEPVLTPVRNFMLKNVPNLMGTFDWSPLALWVIISLLRSLLSSFRLF